jgi:trehalose/maltose hydrolase-like predicted phosphorylase
VSDWSWTYEGFDPREQGLRETLCALGNGYLCTRGAAPEATADGVNYPGTYIAGCYDRLSTLIAHRNVENESLVNVPNWLPLTFAAAGSPWFSLDSWTCSEHHLELDLRRGVLTRRLRVRDPKGRHTKVTQRRIVHMAMPHVAALETTIVPEDWTGQLTVRSLIDGGVVNMGVPRYRDLEGRHLRPVTSEEVAEDSVLLRVETQQSQIQIAEAARTRVSAGPPDRAVTRTLVWEPDQVGHDLALVVTPGDEVTVEKVVAFFTSRDTAMSEPGLAACQELRWAGDFDSLLEAQEAAYEQIWQRFRFVLTADGTGEGEPLRTVRLHVFHLLQTVSPNTLGLDVGIPARGLHGEAYRGHVFWDELFVLPFLSVRLPSLARSLLGYRYRRLPAARRAAAAAGYGGAMFPWQSGSDGREESQTLHLNPVSGRWLPDATYLQRHVGLAIAYNVWQHYQATADLEFLTATGAELILEIARFFASLATYDRSRQRYVIRGVVGPDEFHTGYQGAESPGIDNNAYTNVMVTWLLQWAEEAIEALSHLRRTELLDSLNIQTAERRLWQDIAEKMLVPIENGIISQFEGYANLKPFPWETYRTKYGDLQRLDRILEAEGDSAENYQVSKQADVLMLLYVLSPTEVLGLLDRLGYQLQLADLQRTVDHYLARTTHGSTLSAVVHAWVLARAERGETLEQFRRALASDAQDVQGGTTAEGIHLAAMAGTVDLLQRCFAGLHVRDQTLWLDPYWPEGLGELSFDIVFQEQVLTITVTGEGAHVAAAADGRLPVRCACGDRTALLHPGEQIFFGGISR